MTSVLGMDDFRGIIPPLLSTFDADEKLDMQLFAGELSFMVESGVRIAVVGGGTGEGDGLTPDELATLVEAVAATDGLRAVASIITTTQRDAVYRAQRARDAGASALMIAQPMFHTPSTDALVAFVDAIWREVSLPAIFYNHWGLPAEVVATVAQHEAVLAIKEGSLATLGKLTQILSGEAEVLTGDDPVNLAGYALGATGAIAGLNTVLPVESLAIYKYFTDGNVDEARRVATAISTLARMTMNPVNFPSRTKHVIEMQGRKVGRPRRPYAEIDASEHAALADALEKAKAALTRS